MEFKALYLRNFRNYKDASIYFSAGINHIYGNNAQGKTNLLEAIHFLITGRSFRTRHLQELIFYGAKEFYLEAHFVKNGIEQSLKISCDGQQRRIWHNHTLIPTLSGLLGLFLGVILSPEDSDLVMGAPAVRRQFLDLHIAQSHPLFVYHLTRYHRATKQRNALLRNKSVVSIESWEQEMALSGAYVAHMRKSTVVALSNMSKPFQQFISTDYDELHLDYKSAAKDLTLEDLQQYYLAQYCKQRPRELEYGSTQVGPHKDDLLIFLGNKEARFFGSEGQKRSLVASLRLAQWSQLQQATEELPLMCIDDLGISLDRHREDQLYRQLQKLGQVFVTSPQPISMMNSAHLIQVNGGSFVEGIKTN